MIQPYYQDDFVTLYHGDCREIVPTLGRFDLLLTDPPYGLKRFKNGIGNSDRFKNKAGSGFNNDVPDAVFFNILVSSSFCSMIWGMNNFDLPKTEHFLVWDKMQTVENFASAEIAWTNIPKPAKVFRHGIHKHNQAKFGGHPTEKPTQLMQWCINLAGDNVQTILDPFAGSGTTGRAAKDLGKKCTLIEREESYCEIAAKRMEQECFQFI